MDLLNVLISVYLPDGLLFLPHCRQNYRDLVKQEFRPQTKQNSYFQVSRLCLGSHLDEGEVRHVNQMLFYSQTLAAFNSFTIVK